MTERKDAAQPYAQAGVDTEAAEAALGGVLDLLHRTYGFPRGARQPLLPIGLFANVVKVAENLGIAISTDGVGTKALVARRLGKFDTIGIDCVAMNVNDVLCVGAEPIALVDYVAVEALEPGLLQDLVRGICAGAELARISVPGGETAQMPDLISGVAGKHGFDLVGTCIGTVALDRLIVGQAVQPGDVVLGLASDGIHSNGLTLARQVLLRDKAISPGRGRYLLEDRAPELGGTLGEALLRPTHIYVREVMVLLDAAVDVRALVHLTGDGFLNLPRVQAPVGFHLDFLPEPHPIFGLIQREGKLDDAEMYRVFNMGVGFCVVVPPEAADRAGEIIEGQGTRVWRLGRAVADPERRLWLEPKGLVGSRREGRFTPIKGDPFKG